MRSLFKYILNKLYIFIYLKIEIQINSYYYILIFNPKEENVQQTRTRGADGRCCTYIQLHYAK